MRLRPYGRLYSRLFCLSITGSSFFRAGFKQIHTNLGVRLWNSWKERFQKENQEWMLHLNPFLISLSSWRVEDFLSLVEPFQSLKNLVAIRSLLLQRSLLVNLIVARLRLLSKSGRPYSSCLFIVSWRDNTDYNFWDSMLHGIQ